MAKVIEFQPKFSMSSQLTIIIIIIILDTTGNMYKNAISRSNCPPGHQPILVPRNLKQIQNLQHRVRQKSRLSHDAIYNLHELAYDLDGFVQRITTYPNLVVVCGLNTIADHLNSVLLVNSQGQLLSYDTTFQLGDFYLSSLLYRHTLFSTLPVIPAVFLIHERKFQNVHEECFQQVAKLVPNLVTGKVKVPLVTDDEKGICQV